MLELVLGQIFGFFIIGSALHGIYTIIHFQIRRLPQRPFMKKALQGFWVLCLFVFSMSYISSLNRVAQRPWTVPVVKGAGEVQAAQTLSEHLLAELKGRCSELSYADSIASMQLEDMVIAPSCRRVLK